MRVQRLRPRGALLLVAIAALGGRQGIPQTAPERVPQIYYPQPKNWTGRLVNPYEVRRVSPLNMQNSNRIYDLIRAGQLYLSLYDAIALALENNLDIQLERYLPLMADTDVRRARGGGIVRGLSLLVNEPPPGIGGPNGPLLTTLTSGSLPSPLVNTNFSDIALISQQQNNLSVLGEVPLSTGPLIPQYDPIINGLIQGAHLSTPEFSTVLTGSNWLISDSVTANAGLIKGFSPGTQLSATFNNTRLTTNAQFYTYNPILNSNLGFTVTQPLLRGFGIAVNRRFIRIAKNSERIADLVFQQQAIDTVAGIARLYTDLVSLAEDVKVKEEALLFAQRLYEDNKNKVEQGTLAPIELTRAEAQVAANRQALITAQGLVKQQELIVKTFITRGGLADPVIRDAHLIPTDPVSVPDRDPIDPIQDLFAEAFQDRPDLNQAGIQVENTRIALKGSRNAVRPELDIVGMVQNNALTGDLNPLAMAALAFNGMISPTVTPGGYGTAIGQIFRNNYPSYSIGIQLALPLRNRVAQADAVRDELELRQAEVRRRQLEDQIRLEVANALVSMQQARAAYEAAVQTRVLQEQSVNVEQQRFSVGVSTNYQVLQFETYLAQARSTEVAAKGAYAKARIAFERALGKTLEANHVTIFEAFRGQAGRPPAPVPQR